MASFLAIFGEGVDSVRRVLAEGLEPLLELHAGHPKPRTNLRLVEAVLGGVEQDLEVAVLEGNFLEASEVHLQSALLPERVGAFDQSVQCQLFGEAGELVLSGREELPLDDEQGRQEPLREDGVVPRHYFLGRSTIIETWSKVASSTRSAATSSKYSSVRIAQASGRAFSARVWRNLGW